MPQASVFRLSASGLTGVLMVDESTAQSLSSKRSPFLDPTASAFEGPSPQHTTGGGGIHLYLDQESPRFLQHLLGAASSK